METKIKYVNSLLIDIINDAIKIGIPVSDKLDKEIIIDHNRYDRVGACYRLPAQDKQEIHLSEDVLNGNEYFIKSIIAHEVLHTCFLCIGHECMWDVYKNKMNKAYNYGIKVEYSWEEILKK